MPLQLLEWSVNTNNMKTTLHQTWLQSRKKAGRSKDKIKRHNLQNYCWKLMNALFLSVQLQLANRALCIALVFLVLGVCGWVTETLRNISTVCEMAESWIRWYVLMPFYAPLILIVRLHQKEFVHSFGVFFWHCSISFRFYGPIFPLSLFFFLRSRWALIFTHFIAWVNLFENCLFASSCPDCFVCGILKDGFTQQ